MKESLSFSFDFSVSLCPCCYFCRFILFLVFAYCACLFSLFFVNRKEEEPYVATRGQLCGLRSKLSVLIIVEHVKLI